MTARQPPAPQTVLELELVSPQLECRPAEAYTQLVIIDRGFCLRLNFPIWNEGISSTASLTGFAQQVLKAVQVRRRQAAQLPLWQNQPLAARRPLRLEVTIRADLEVRREENVLLARTGETLVQLRFSSERGLHRFASVLNSWYLGQRPEAIVDPVQSR